MASPLPKLPLLRQLYTQYNENYEQALATYEKLKRENKKFQDFISVRIRSRGCPLTRCAL